MYFGVTENYSHSVYKINSSENTVYLGRSLIKFLATNAGK